MNWIKRNLFLLIVIIILLVIGLYLYSDFIKEWSEVIAAIIYIFGIIIGIDRLKSIENKIRGTYEIIKIAKKFIKKEDKKEFEFKIVNISKNSYVFNIKVKFILGYYFLTEGKNRNTKTRHTISIEKPFVQNKNKNDDYNLHAQRIIIEKNYDKIKEYFEKPDVDDNIKSNRFIRMDISFEHNGIKKAVSQTYKYNDCVTKKGANFKQGDDCNII